MELVELSGETIVCSDDLLEKMVDFFFISLTSWGRASDSSNGNWVVGDNDEDPWILPPEILILQYSLHSIAIDGESLKNSNCFQGKLSAV